MTYGEGNVYYYSFRDIAVKLDRCYPRPNAVQGAKS